MRPLPIYRTRKSPKRVAAAKRAWVTIRLNQKLENIKWRIAGLEAYRTRLIHQSWNR